MKRIIANVPNSTQLKVLVGIFMDHNIDFRVDTVTAPPSGKKIERKRVSGTTQEHTIMGHYGPQLGFPLDRADEWLVKVGYHPGSARNALYRLVEKGYVSQIDATHFRFERPMVNGS